MPKDIFYANTMVKVVVVDGNIGVGKTTFVGSIANALDMRVVDEPFADNPYLEDFYKDPHTPGVAYKTEEWFIRNRLESYEGALAASPDERTVIVDRPPSSTLVFVTVMYEDGKLDEEEYENLLALYQDVSNRVVTLVGEPDLYIYLDASPERCLQSIKSRGRPMEQGIKVEYLKHLGEVWKRMSANFYSCPYVVVDWEDYGEAYTAA